MSPEALRPVALQNVRIVVQSARRAGMDASLMLTIAFQSVRKIQYGFFHWLSVGNPVVVRVCLRSKSVRFGNPAQYAAPEDRRIVFTGTAVSFDLFLIFSTGFRTRDLMSYHIMD